MEFVFACNNSTKNRKLTILSTMFPIKVTSQTYQFQWATYYYFHY